MGTRSKQLFEDLAGFIRSGELKGFNGMALQVFEYQYAHNPVYRAFCIDKAKTPDTVETWKDIPVVPTGAFKDLDLSCGPAEKVFLTSGTTGGPEKRGRHPVMGLELYRESILANFSSHLLPDRARMRMFILTGSPHTWKHSSLAHMMEVVRGAFGADGSDYYINDSGLEEDRLISDLKTAIRQKRPVFLLGITLAFYQLMERLRLDGYKFSLPAGSRIMDTGGFKGRRIQLSKESLYSWYQDVLGIPSPHIVNEYGMTEM
ncbi:MAG TPA: long-chain fatty acid--CoA ligase, partial [Nitrospiria bacterium]|nr:long-chain fatty acid--CoA ligase [Nitrospiria bacterium]